MRATWARRTVGVLVASLATTGLVACDRQVTGPSLVLRLVTSDKPTDDTAGAINHFAEEVDRRSGGTIRVDPVWRVAEGQPHVDQVVTGLVADGTYDLALVPGRAFDDLGVDTLRALNAPFLVTSHAALDAVLSSEVRERMLEDLPRAGVVGLDILPNALRHPFGYSSPLVGLADYHHALVQAPYSRAVNRLFHEFGADVAEYPPPDLRGGVESQFSRAPAGVQYATGNVTFYPRTDVLVAGVDVRDRLRADQWSVLLGAAGATREWQAAQQPSDFEAAAAFCDHGGVIVAATDEEVDELRKAAQDVTDWLREDGSTSRLIDQIELIADDVSVVDPITACPGNVGHARTTVDGVYRARVRQSDLLRAGVSKVQARENSGLWTWTLDGDMFTFHTESSRYLNHPDDSGRLTYDGGVLVIYWDETAGDYSTLTVRVAPNGDLHFRDVRESLPENQALGEGLFAIPWRRVGDLPE